MSKAAGYILAVLATAAICLFVASRCKYMIKEPPQERIVYKPSKVTRTVKDTIRVIVRETQIDTMHDTVFVYLPQESIVWQDDRCIVYAHGINPQVDSVTHFNSGTVVTRTVTGRPKRWGIGVSAGYGMSKDGLSPYIGLGISYNIIRF